MTRVEHIGDATLYLGDCREILPGLGKVNAVVTDPPYDEYTHRGATHKSVKLKEFGIGFGALENLNFVKPLLDMTSDWLLFFCGLEMLGSYQAVAPEKYVRGAIWDRIVNSPQLSGDRPAQGGEGIAIFHARRKNMEWNGGGKAGLFRHMVERGCKEHPTQKPLSLMREIVELFTNDGDLVLDPFMGGCSTGVACVKLGRRFIGIEIEPEHFETACRRIQKAYDQPDFFVEKPAPIKQQELL